MTVNADDRILWNGEAIDLQKLAEYSSILPTMAPIPFTILQIEDGASCGLVQQTRNTINVGAKCLEWGRSRCGEGVGPWAEIGDVIGPNGETSKYWPDGRHETIPATEERRAELNALMNEVDAVLEEANSSRE